MPENWAFSKVAVRPIPTLVQLLAYQGAERLRGAFAERGMAGLRPLHARLFLPLLSGGRRASDLADRLGVSRQAVAQVVVILERDGYVERLADPGDARAKLICLTARGRLAVRVMRNAALAEEERWRHLLGAEPLEQVRDALIRLLSDPHR